MVTIQFALNEDKIKEAGYSVAVVEKYLRSFYMKRNAPEIAYLTFQRDDENAMCNLGDIFGVMAENPEFMAFLDKCVWDVDGVIEDCLQEIKECIAKYGR